MSLTSLRQNISFLHLGSLGEECRGITAAKDELTRFSILLLSLFIFKECVNTQFLQVY